MIPATAASRSSGVAVCKTQPRFRSQFRQTAKAPLLPTRRSNLFPVRSDRRAAPTVASASAAEIPSDVKSRRNPAFPFTKIVGQDQMKLALLLNVIDRNIGGVLIMGDRGTAKSACVRALVELLPEIDVVPEDPFNSSPDDPSLMGPECLEAFQRGEELPRTKARTPLVELPLGATEDRICGTIDIEKALMEGKRAYEPGLLAAANRGILYVDEANLLDDGLVDVVLDSAAGGLNTVEREGISVVHPAKFIMVGSGNPEEGEMRPQLLDRFGLKVSVATIMDVKQRTQLVLNRMAYDKDPEKFAAEAQADQEALRQKLQEARERLPEVTTPYEVKLLISEVCSRCDVDGLRGDLVTNRAAAALVALEGRTEVTVEDVGRVIGMCLSHRMRKDVMDGIDNSAQVEAIFRRVADPEARERDEAEKKAKEEAKAKAEEEAKAGNKRAGMKPGAWGGLPGR
uniref:Mg-protoporphyrin IX chelatase n=1 Tax=Tetraselmis sp. GSL018 TaxID=582737 RepID=A0A061R6E6_9CHLO|mmetsp:Transcript_31002/g.73712  ORF Transcript_31002/g.73712 Transcript_31002/m.73712 type:complete len:457 (-) Transcript_31002:233-1603(-)